MADIELLRASYRSHPGLFMHPDAGIEQRIERLSELVAEEIEATLGDLDQPVEHYLSSTILDGLIASSRCPAANLLARIARYTAHAPNAIVNAYECAGWGFVLRHAQRERTLPTLVACTIVDLNVLDLSFWTSSVHWGRSGYGIAVLLLRVPPEPQGLAVGWAKTDMMMAEFAVAVRKTLQAGSPGRRLALPMFPEPVAQLFDRLLPGVDRLPDLHERLGHCFGSDPWILILQSIASGDDRSVLLACSLALNGYWALGRVVIVDGARTRLRLDRCS